MALRTMFTRVHTYVLTGWRCMAGVGVWMKSVSIIVATHLFNERELVNVRTVTLGAGPRLQCS
jgi:hypothetical protein